MSALSNSLYTSNYPHSAFSLLPFFHSFMSQLPTNPFFSAAPIPQVTPSWNSYMAIWLQSIAIACNSTALSLSQQAIAQHSTPLPFARPQPETFSPHMEAWLKERTTQPEPEETKEQNPLFALFPFAMF